MAEPTPPSDTPPPRDDPAPAEAPSDPGAPAVDEELAGLKPRRPRRSPVTALAVIAVGGLLMFHLRDEIRYALSPKAPEELAARGLDLGSEAGRRALEMRIPASGRYAAVSGLPDYRNALLFEPKGDRFRRAFFPVLGTRGRLLVRADETSTRRDLSERFVGRLRRFDDLAYAEQLRTYYATKDKASHLVDLAAAREVLGAAGAGKPFSQALAGAGRKPIDHQQEIDSLAPAHPVLVVIDFPEDLKVALSRDKFAVEEDARREVERLGRPVVGPALETKEAYVYVVRVPPAERNAYIAKLDEKEIPFAVHQERLATTAGELALSPDGQGVAVRGASYPWSQVASIQVDTPIHIPQDAWILVEGEAPGGYSWAPLLAGLLCLFILFNLWLLYRSLAARRQTT